MDKKNTTIGIVLFIAAAICFYWSAQHGPPRANPAAVRQATAPAAAPAPAGAPAAEANTPPVESTFVSANLEQSGSTFTVLENSFVQVRFTDFGGAIRDVAFKKYPATQHSFAPFVFNQLHADPILGLVNLPGLDRRARYQLVSKSDREVVYRAVLPGQLEVTRRYVLSPDHVGTTDPYEIRTETTFRNLSAKAAAPMPLAMSVGTAAPVSTTDTGYQLTAGYSNGKSQDFFARRKLEASGGFFGVAGAHPAVPAIELPGPIVWATASNQFFASVLTPDRPASELTIRRVKLLKELPDTDSSAYGVTDTANFELGPIAPHGRATLGGDLYVGPKEYHRLANPDVFKADQDKVMQFGFFKFFSEILLTLMTWVHRAIPNWGLSIICTTLMLKALFLPLTLAASRSAKRMQKIQPQLKAIAEKYKDNPQKKNTATMELFKQHRVNPMGGCLPMLITIPFFYGFFKMLYSAAELRFAPFLWAHDLSAPDTVGHVFGIAINILPILLGITSFVQMQLTPQPTVDSSQAKMMKFTPLIFVAFCYSYSCALSLYSTTNGIFTIVQQLIINRMKDVPPPAPAVDSRGRPVKNVTPSKRR